MLSSSFARSRTSEFPTLRGAFAFEKSGRTIWSTPWKKEENFKRLIPFLPVEVSALKIRTGGFLSAPVFALKFLWLCVAIKRP